MRFFPSFVYFEEVFVQVFYDIVINIRICFVLHNYFPIKYKMLTNTYSTNSCFLPSFSTVDHWLCSSCSFKNDRTNYPTCVICHQIDSQFLQYTIVPSSSTSMWKCPGCTWKNDERNIFCESCFQAKHLSVCICTGLIIKSNRTDSFFLLE